MAGEPQSTRNIAVQCRMPGFSKLKLQAHAQHSSSVLNNFNSLRLQGGVLCDCVLVVEEEQFKVHKSLLAVCSPYFQALFTSQMKESQSFFIKIGGVEALTFKTVLDFIYTGEIFLDEANVTKVYPAAKLFQLDLLQNICRDYFLNQLCTTNCLGIWRYARMYSDTVLEKSAWFYVSRHFKDVAMTDEFLALSSANLCKILQSDELNVDDEMMMYSALVRWLQHDLKTRKQEFTSIALCIRFPLFPDHSLATLISTDNLVLSDKKLKDLLIQAKNVQRLRSTKSRQQSNSAFHKQSLTPRRSSTSVAVIGGYNGGPVEISERFCESSSEWHEADSLTLPSCKHLHWVGVIGLRMYAIGGTLTNCDLLMSRFTSTAVDFLQSSTLCTEWEVEATLPCDCSSMQFCTMHECVYGCGETTLDGTQVYGITRYNPSVGSWEYLTSMPSPRISIGLLSHNGKLYLVGGMNPSTGEVVKVLESYDPTANTWQVYPSMTTGRYHLGVAVMCGCIYAIGGIGDEQGEINIQLKSVERFSLDSKQWSCVQHLPSTRASMAVCVWRGKIFVIGGETASSVSSADVLMYEPSEDEWEDSGTLHHPRIYPNAMVL